MKWLGQEVSGGCQYPRTGFQLLAPLLALVLPSGDRQVLLPEPVRHRAESPVAFGDQRRSRRQRTIGRDRPHRAVIQRPFPQPGQPSPQRRMHWPIRPDATHYAPQSRPRRVRIGVAGTGRLNNRQGETLEGKQLARQHTDARLAVRAAGQRNAQDLSAERSALRSQHRTTLNGPRRVNQRPYCVAPRANEFGVDVFALDSAPP